MKNFESFNLNPALVKSLAHMNYTKPTPIQAQSIPLALEGRDIMGTAQTGTGKTAAFAIPLIEKLLSNPQGSALVLTPTRELGKQIMDIMHQLLGPKSPIKTAFIIGGESMGKQLDQLRSKPRLIVGTPGRINDHLNRGSLKLEDTHFLVLDETDRMLDMGFTIQIERIFSYMPKERQTLMFSATLPKNILKLSEKYLSNPQRVSVGEVNVVASNIKQEAIRIEQNKKYDELLTQLVERNGSVIVFVKTKYGADKMAKNLRRDGHESEALHGDLRQSKREKVMKNFRNMKFRILIATDIAARGLDVPHIEHVINYDLPQVAEDFIHRMGRTARAGAQGSAISFISNQDGRKWHAIERLLNPEAANDRGKKKRKPAKNDKSRRGKSNGKPFGKAANGKAANGKNGGKPFGKKFKAVSGEETSKKQNRKSNWKTSSKPNSKPEGKSSNKSTKKSFGKPFGKVNGSKPNGKSGGKKCFYRGKKKAA
jgi:ATP-dependent RNA helicase DeaD